MRKNPTKFRERFQRWKEGKQVYENGRPLYVEEDDNSDEVVYKEIMKDVARKNYKTWGYSSPNDAWQDQINNPTYDYRKFYTDPKFYDVSANAEQHWPDAYKTPLHESFSNESFYHGKKSNKNPYGLRGGQWVGDRFIPAAWQNPIRIPKYEDGLMPKFSDGNEPYIRSTIEDAALKAAKASGNYVPDSMNKYPYQKDLHTPLSPVDPVGEFTVGNAVLGTPLKLAGKALMYGVGRYGEKLGLNKLSNWAKAKLISGAVDDAVATGEPGTAEEFIFPGSIGWGPKQTFKGYHASNEKVFEPYFFYKGWAQKTHNAPYGIYVAEGTAPESGFLAKRPYVHQVETTLDKPMVQIGEVNGKTKNGIRNQIERTAQSLNADGIIFRDIADNQMRHQTILKTLNPDTKITRIRPQENPVNASVDYSTPDEVDEISRELATKVLMKSAKEQEGFGMSAVGEDKQFSEDVSNIIYNTVLPRMQLMRPGYRGGLLFPTVKSRVASAVDRGYTEYPEWLFDRYSKTTQGIHFPETGHIAIRKGQLGFAGPHEIRHRIDDGGLSLTETEDEILRSAYGDDFVNLSKLIDRFKNMNLYKERATTNLDARTRLLEENGLIDAPLESQNALIDAIGDDRLFDYIATANGYGQEYINYLRNNNLLTAKKADAFRKSMKYVGASAAPLGFYNLYREK